LKNVFLRSLTISSNSHFSSLFVCWSAFGGCSSTCQVKSLGSSKFEITITDVGVEVRVVRQRNCNAALSSSKFLHFSYTSKVLTSSTIGFCEAKGSM